MGGTLIGAIRHRGFIPWDDDIDVAMPRADYERLIEASADGIDGRYIVRCGRNSRKHIYPFVKVYDTKTYLVEDRHVPDPESGVFIDVFPIDFVPSDFGAYARKVRIVGFLRRLASLAATAVRTSKKGRLVSAFRLAFVGLLRIVGPAPFLAMIDKAARSHDARDETHCAVVVWGYGTRERMVARDFFPQTTVEFGGRNFTASADYDTYLRSLFGDYMTPPDEIDRVARHEYSAWWRDKE